MSCRGPDRGSGAADRHVILISLDGFAAYHLQQSGAGSPEPPGAGRCGGRRREQRDRVSEPDAPVAHHARHWRHTAPAWRDRQHGRESAYRRSGFTSPIFRADDRFGRRRSSTRSRAPAGGLRRSSGPRRRTIRPSTTTSPKSSTRKAAPIQRCDAGLLQGLRTSRRANRQLLRVLRRPLRDKAPADIALTRAAAYVFRSGGRR